MNPLTTTARGISDRATQKSSTSTVKNVSELAGRILLSGLFLLSGVGKVGAYAATAAYMSSVGVPGVLLPVVIATEVLGAIAIILGWQTRVSALLLAGYSLLVFVPFAWSLVTSFKTLPDSLGLGLIPHPATTYGYEKAFTELLPDMEAGFGDLSYFNRAFRRRYGTTPSEVRAAVSR